MRLRAGPKRICLLVGVVCHQLLLVPVKHNLQGLRVNAGIGGLRADLISGVGRVDVFLVMNISHRVLIIILHFPFLLFDDN
jgi:hypothetical protein